MALSSPLLETVLDTHGGLETWQRYCTLEAHLSFGGLAFATRFKRGGLRERRLQVSIKQPKVIFDAFPTPGTRGIFTPEYVCLENAMGTRAERDQPRAFFSNFRRQLYWDDLDLLYFSGYAIWNYLTTPFLLASNAIQTKELEPWHENDQVWRRLKATFPNHIPTHCTEQIFYFDPGFELKRLDYDPEIFAPWARAAHYCTAYTDVSGIRFPMKRYVVPRRPNGTTLAGPKLVWIDITSLTLIP